jgi:hypothetical protein
MEAAQRLRDQPRVFRFDQQPVSVPVQQVIQQADRVPVFQGPQPLHSLLAHARRTEDLRGTVAGVADVVTALRKPRL